MAGIGDLLSVLMQGGLSSAGNQRAGNAMGGLGQSGGMLGQVLGGGTAQGSTGGSDLLGSLMGVAKEMMTLNRGGTSIQMPINRRMGKETK